VFFSIEKIITENRRSFYGKLSQVFDYRRYEMGDMGRKDRGRIGGRLPAKEPDIFLVGKCSPSRSKKNQKQEPAEAKGETGSGPALDEGPRLAFGVQHISLSSLSRPLKKVGGRGNPATREVSHAKIRGEKGWTDEGARCRTSYS